MCVTTSPPIRGDPISHSQAHIPLKPLPPALDPDPDTDSDSDSDADSSSDSGSDVGDVFDSDDSSDSEGAGDGASANDQCVDIISARGVWGLAHVFNNKLFFTRDIMDDDAVPKHFNVPEPKPKPKLKPAPKGMHVLARCAGNFFFRGTGLPTAVRKNQPLVPRSNTAGSWTRGVPSGCCGGWGCKSRGDPHVLPYHLPCQFLGVRE